MRVALVFKRFALLGGTEGQVAMLAEDLATRGHEVHVFCRSVRTDPPEGVQIHRMPAVPLGSLGEALLFPRWALGAVSRHERSHGPFDVRHAFGRTVGQDVYRVGGGCHQSYLDHAHALDRPAWLRRWLVATPLQRVKADLEKRALCGRPSPHVMTNSRMTRDDLLFRYGLDARQMHVIPNGIDLQRFRLPEVDERTRVRSTWGLAADEPVALFLGSGYARKGLEPTLRALALLEPPLPRLVVVGRDRRPDRWRRLAQSLGVSSRILWLGACSEPEHCYRGADVYVLPTAYDAAANSTLEALASGLPVITSVMNGAAEILDDGVHGTILETPVSPQELAAALSHWLGESETDALAARCRERAERYPADESCTSMLEVYQAVIQDRVDRGETS